MTASTDKRAVESASAPKAIGPYSQAIVAGNLVFCSGQIPLDPLTGQLVEGDIRVQTARVLDNLAAVLAAAHVGFDAVVRTTIFLVDLGDFNAVNEVYGGYFQSAPPARVTVQVSALPRGARVEIDAIAVYDRQAKASAFWNIAVALAAELGDERIVVVVGVVTDAADHLLDLDGIETGGGAIGRQHDVVAAQAERRLREAAAR